MPQAVSKSRIRALVGVAVLAFASALATSPPASARALYTRHCSWSYGYRHCHYQRYYPRHRYYYRHYHRYPYCYYHRCYYPRPGWNNRY